MSALLVVRSTRAEEEAGRTELLRARVAGRHSAPVAALAVVAGANAAVAVGAAGGLLASGLDPAGSSALAASFAAFGLLMAAVGLVMAPLTEQARAASGAALAVLAAAAPGRPHRGGGRLRGGRPGRPARP